MNPGDCDSSGVVLGMELRSSVRAVGTFSHWAISPAPISPSDLEFSEEHIGVLTCRTVM